MKIYKYVLTLVLCLVTGTIVAQRNEIFNERIATVQVVAGDDWLSPPVTNLYGNPIHISFDDLTHEYHRYTYKIEHCEADWSVSDQLFETDYIDGFTEGNIIDDVEESLNTNVLYTHYRLSIPNEHCRLKMSGNYRLTVIDDNNDDEPMFSVCFYVVNPQIGVSLNVSSNTDIDINSSHQQVTMGVKYAGLRVINPTEQIQTVVMQNGRWDNAVVNARPQFTMSDGLTWQNCRDFIFDAGNEYHKFEVLDTDHPTLGIDRIRWDGKVFHAFVIPDEPRPNYLYDEDANGAFYIRNSDNIENDRISDYVRVHFQLLCPEPVDGDVYLNGVWTNDQFLPEYRMEYDEMSRSYEAEVLLKMGYYSYQYVLIDNKGYAQVMPTEGSFFQTENKYQAFVYYREPGGRTDLLLGYQQVQFK
ncbi:MAG: DUF5103 domain-containing protein [Prevotella sp.]|nr:DUF5103 domain-containing protein [Prevotella sp.]